MGNNFVNKELGSILFFGNGKRRPSEVGNIPVYGGNGILGYTNKDNNENCIAIGRVGKYCGSVYFVNTKCWISDNCIWAKAKNNCDLSYAFYLLKTLNLNSKHIGTSQPLMTQGILNSLEVNVPPLPIQKKIASILSSIDDKIELNNKMNANLLMCIQLDVLKTLPYNFDDAVDGWKSINLSEIADFHSGYSYKGNELQANPNCAMATIKNFERGGGFKIEGFKEIKPSSKLKATQYVEVFDTLVAHTDLTQKAEVAGNAEIVLSNGGYIKLIMSMDLVKVLPKLGYSKFLIAGLLSDRRFKNHALKYINGSTVLHMSKSALPEYKLLIPKDKTILDNLAERLETQYKLI